MAKPISERYCADPDDGLRVEIIQDWSVAKHQRLRRYVDIAHKARAKFPRGGSSYVDLYCGPGRARVEEDAACADAGAVAAVREALRHTPFTSIHIGDTDPENLDACRSRLDRAGATGVCTYLGPAEQTVSSVVERLHPRGLHLVYLDPYSLGQLPFSVIAALAKFEHIDFMIHFAWMDLQRNLKSMVDDGRLERAVPGCARTLNFAHKKVELRRQVYEHWRALIEGLGLKFRGKVIQVTGGRNQSIYRLVFASRHPLAEKFWTQIADVERQRGLFGG